MHIVDAQVCPPDRRSLFGTFSVGSPHSLSRESSKNRPINVVFLCVAAPNRAFQQGWPTPLSRCEPPDPYNRGPLAPDAPDTGSGLRLPRDGARHNSTHFANGTLRTVPPPTVESGGQQRSSVTSRKRTSIGPLGSYRGRSSIL